ncbi:MAG: sugar phosphate isomerase/epimerase family protein [Balneolales bacterium]
MKRRDLIKSAAILSAFTSTGFIPSRQVNTKSRDPESAPYKIKLSLNAYSFHSLLQEGSMDLFDLIDFCSAHGFDAVDLTGYYFPGYPDVPPDKYLYELKRKAFLQGLAISGTGIRNEFADPDEQKRRDDIQLIKRWVVAASKMGAPVLRIFTGHLDIQNYTREQVLEWMVNDIRECVEFGKKHGVIIAVQNHNAFIKTAAQTLELIKLINHEWFGWILDTGSYRQGDPYLEITDVMPYAVSWQLKELIYINGDPVEIDLDKIFTIIKKAGYQGYIPIETLGPGDPYVKVPEFLRKVKMAFGAHNI